MSIDVSPKSTTPASPIAWPVLLCYAGMAVIAIAVNLPPVYLTTFGQEFNAPVGLNDQQLGWIGTLLFVGLTAGLLISSPLADRWGAKAFVILGNALIAAGLGLMAAAPSYAVLLWASFIMGFGAGVLDMILSPIVAALQPANRTSAMNWLHSFYAIGKIFITLIASLAISLSITWPVFGWRNLALAVIVVPVLTLFGFIKANLPPLVAADQKRTSSRTLLRSSPFLIAIIAMLLAGATELGMAQWLPAYAETSLGYPKWLATQALTAFAVAMAVGRIAGGWISHHIRPMPLLLLCCGASIALYLIGALCPLRSVALIACIGVGLAVSILWPTVLGITADRFPHGGAMLFGLLAAAGNLGGIINLGIGSIAKHSSLNMALATVAICPLVMAGLLVYLHRRHGHDDGTAPVELPIVGS